MKKYLLVAAAVAALGSAAPASAQLGGVIQQGIQGLLGGGGLNSRLLTLDNQIRLSFQRGELSQSEAANLKDELIRLRQLDQSYRIDGLNRMERQELQQRLAVLERRFQQARYDRDDRYDDDDRWDRDGYGRGACPPGLAKKNNGCLPPGQAKKMGDRYNGQLGSGYQDTDRYLYRQDGNRVLQIDRRTGRVVRVLNR